MVDADEPSPLRWLLAPALWGLAAASVGSLLWYAMLAATGGHQVGRLGLVLGFCVGGAVRLASRRQGGLACQLLAMVLTYGAITASYVPFLAQSRRPARAVHR